MMTRIYSTLGRKFNKKDLEDAQRMGEELVRGLGCYTRVGLGKGVYRLYTSKGAKDS